MAIKPVISVLWLLRAMRDALKDPKVRGITLVTVALISGATIFYRLVEGWRLIDAAYFSVVTIATVGYGDFTPQTDLGKIFTIVYIFSGIGLFIAAGSAFAESLLRRFDTIPRSGPAADVGQDLETSVVEC
ncbi:potassium channel family protein [Tabrizicola sp. BL-A-41-H6]|uniref:potassium channel family protein n=1 Tax=Tabrizicola sp. BL-A-41-H6 TaxID=3421107 RepID=UPI003D6767D9